ncbi:hypothetical protein ABZ690_09265 [Streptomyces sp. NPDC006967]|uniref:hypothetical protein n=1 Tax=unclassified Streptomyces TaxID=2593676 RepID=UPI000CD531BD|nr:hypothetical protein [Streptomyces sp. SM1]
MPLSKVLAPLGELTLSLLAEARLGPVVLILLFFIGVWAREPRNGRALYAALVLILLTSQA